MDNTHGGTGPAKGLKQRAHGSLHLLVRVEPDPPIVVIHEAHRRLDPQLTAPRFVELTANQSGPQ
jgi:hypothetical protein